MAVHFHKFRAEQCGFVAARSRADFYDDVVVLVGVFGQHGNFEVVHVAVESFAQLVELLFKHFAHFGVLFHGQHFGALVKMVLVSGVNFETLDYRLQIGMFFGQSLERRLVGNNFGTRQHITYFVITGFDFLEFCEHSFADFHISFLFAARNILSAPSISLKISVSNPSNNAATSFACPIPNSHHNSPPSAR